jgi:hypothetical protein
MEGFCKHEDCPTSEDILAFLNGNVEEAVGAGYKCHLLECEFCSAEIEFYRFYPPVDDKAVLEKMPEPLLELAEALLDKKHDLTPLYRLIDQSN